MNKEFEEYFETIKELTGLEWWVELKEWMGNEDHTYEEVEELLTAVCKTSYGLNLLAAIVGKFRLLERMIERIGGNPFVEKKQELQEQLEKERQEYIAKMEKEEQ